MSERGRDSQCPSKPAELISIRHGPSGLVKAQPGPTNPSEINRIPKVISKIVHDERIIKSQPILNSSRPWLMYNHDRRAGPTRQRRRPRSWATTTATITITTAITGIQARAYGHCHTGIVTQARPHGYGLRHDGCGQDSGSTLRQTLTQAGSVRIRQDDQSQTESATARQKSAGPVQAS
jgi:hypothetical protein